MKLYDIPVETLSVIEGVFSRLGYSLDQATSFTELMVDGYSHSVVAKELGLARDELERVIEMLRQELM